MTPRSAGASTGARQTHTPYPFSALVGGEDLQRALLANAVNPAVGGVLVRGEKGTAKSTAVRGLADLLPDVSVVAGDPFACDPDEPDPACPAGPHHDAEAEVRPARLVELPVGASEDRLAGSLDLERALAEGQRGFEPGLLAKAHRGVLYVDEVNLLGDHLVDLLLDAAAMGVNHVEREGVSVRHAAQFQLVGTMNPEEGELRPQLLDRFGLTVDVRASRDRAERAEVVRRRMAYEADPAGFAAQWAEADAEVAARIVRARKLLGEVTLGETALEAVVAACTAFEIDGLRADLVTAKAAAALAAWEGRTDVTVADVRQAALLALPHRRRRGPFESPGIDEDVLDEALSDLDDDPGQPPPDGGPSDGGSDPGDAAGGDGGDDSAGGSAEGGSAPERGSAEGDQPGPGQASVEVAAESANQSSEDGEAGSVDSATESASEPTAPADDEGGTGRVRTLPTGATFSPLLLQLADTGTGAWGRRSPATGRRGHHVADRPVSEPGGELALGATLRAAAVRQAGQGRGLGHGLQIRPGDVREKVRRGREGNLVLFVVDASGSMAAAERMTAVKGAALSLLLDAYQRRDRVGIVTFRGDGADLALPPTNSVELAGRLLSDLPTGGRTPLAAGLERAGAVLATESVRDPDRRPLLVVLTDGRATRGGADPVAEAEHAAGELGRRHVAGVVVDTEGGAVRLGLAGRVADAMGAPAIRLEQLAADSLSGLVRGITTGANRGGGRSAA